MTTAGPSAQLARQGVAPPTADPAGGEVQAVDVDSLALSRPRSVGAESVPLCAGGIAGGRLRDPPPGTNELTWDAEPLWWTYTMLTDLEVQLLNTDS